MAQQITPAPVDGSPSTTNTRREVVPAVLRESDAAHYVAMSRAFLKKARLVGHGPAFVRVRRTISYRTADLDRWLESHLVRRGGAGSSR